MTFEEACFFPHPLYPLPTPSEMAAGGEMTLGDTGCAGE